MSFWHQLLQARAGNVNTDELASHLFRGIPLDWPLRAQLYEWQCAHLDRDATMRPFDGAGIVAFANERAGLVPPAVAEALALELAHRRTRRRIRAVLAAGAASNGSDIAASNDSGGGPLPREEHVRAIVMAHAAATRLEHFVPGSATLASLLLHQHSQSPAAAAATATAASAASAPSMLAPAPTPHVPGTRSCYVPGQLLQRSESGPSVAASTSNTGTGAGAGAATGTVGGGNGGPASTVNFQAAISAAYLSYAAVMVQCRQLMRQNGALLRADTLVLADVLARRGGPALTAHFAARAFDAQCLFECVRTWAGDCFVFGGVAGGAGAGVGIGGGTGGSGGSGAIRGLPGADAVDEAPLALTLYLLDIMVFLGSSATLSVFGAMILHADNKADPSSTTPASMLRSIDSESAFYAAIADLPATVFAANATAAQSSVLTASGRISATIAAIGARAAALFSLDDDGSSTRTCTSTSTTHTGADSGDDKVAMHRRWVDARRAVNWARAIDAGDLRIGVSVGTEAHARAAAQSRADEANQKQQVLLQLQLQQQQQQQQQLLLQQQSQQRPPQIRVVAQPGAGGSQTHARRNSHSDVVVIVRAAPPASLTPSSSAAALPSLPSSAASASAPASSQTLSSAGSPSPSSVDARLLAENQELQRRVIELTRRAFEAQKRADAAVEAAAAAAAAGTLQAQAPAQHPDSSQSAEQTELAAAAAMQPSGRLSTSPSLRDLQLSVYRASHSSSPSLAPGVSGAAVAVASPSAVADTDAAASAAAASAAAASAAGPASSDAAEAAPPALLRYFSMSDSPLPFEAVPRVLRLPCVFMEGHLGKLSGAGGGFWKSESVGQRWFVLKGPFLTYYKSPDDVRPIKDRALNVRGQRVRALPTHGAGGAIFPFAFCVDIVGSGVIPAAAAARGGRGGTGGLHASVGESFVMFAPTAAVRTAWMDVLRAAAEVGGDA